MFLDAVRLKENGQNLANMTCSLKAGFSISGSSDIRVRHAGKGDFRVCPSVGSLQFRDLNSNWGKTLDLVSDQKGFVNFRTQKGPKLDPVYAQTLVTFGKSQKWWEKSLQPNMVEINSAPELVMNLMNAGDRLVIVDFYSPGCGGCKALHPKICQLAESNPDSTFLMINYEQHKEMCYALHVHVLPFFRFYRGADGRVCSFSCTNATIKKFKDALAKHGTDRCSLGPAKGLSEQELMALASIDQIPMDWVPKKEEEQELLALNQQQGVGKDENKLGQKEGNGLVMV